MAALAFANGSSIGRARRALAAAFREAGLDSPDLDARILVGHVLGLDQAGLAAAAERDLSATETRRIAALGERRLARESVAAIVGSKEFWGLQLRVSAATLVPRPETETVVEAALQAIDAGGSRTRALRIADFGTGSGCLLLALLSELPHAHGVATDISADALALARANAHGLDMGHRASFVRGDFARALAARFDLIVSNPPYVATGELASLAPEVRREPVCALDGGTDGLAAYRAIAACVPPLLAPAGALVLEVGMGQAAAVGALLAAAGLTVGPTMPDLAGVPRAVVAFGQPMR
jgi:release factor glutamine methyltransferase